MGAFRACSGWGFRVFGVQGFRVWGLGLRVWGLGLAHVSRDLYSLCISFPSFVQPPPAAGFRAAGFRGHSLGFGSGLGFRV